MKKQLQILSLLVSILFFGNVANGQSIPIRDYDADFPKSEKLEFKIFNKYPILEEGISVIDGLVLWHLGRGEKDFGSCYDLKTGKKLSTIMSKGIAPYEARDIGECVITDDSVHIDAYPNIIKTFAKRDILENKPMSERKFSVVNAPDTIRAEQMIKLPNGSILATLKYNRHKSYKGKRYRSNENSIVIFNNKKADFYQTIDYDSFSLRQARGQELEANNIIKDSYGNGSIALRGNDLAVFSLNSQFILYTFDLNKGKVLNEKRYTKMERGNNEGQCGSSNELDMAVISIKSSDKYIFCKVRGYFGEKGDRLKLGYAIFVFDWNLKPIKRFDLGGVDTFSISNDCHSIYSSQYTNEGLTLYKADFNL